ncbi:MAG: hypothetical protein AAFV80_14435 [Bacteroidota bacterium]
MSEVLVEMASKVEKSNRQYRFDQYRGIGIKTNFERHRAFDRCVLNDQHKGLTDGSYSVTKTKKGRFLLLYDILKFALFSENQS